MEVELAGVITAIGGVIGAIGGVYSIWTKYHQEEKNKLTDLKIEQYKNEMKRKSFKRAENAGKVFGALNKVLLGTGADRVYIVQPHPLGHAAYLSVQYEVKANGVQGMRMEIQKLEMSEVPQFSEEMTKNLWMYFDDIDNQVEDRVAKSLLASNGTIAVAIKRMNTARDWVGSIFCEFMNTPSVSEGDMYKLMHEAAVNIQYNLPEYQEEE